jgi:rubrerythrin
MPEFTNPFIGNVPDRKLTPGELLRAIRLDYAAEYEATHIYMAQAEATDDPLAKKVLTDIADEERVHAGEFLRLISILTDGEEEKLLSDGAQEVNDISSELESVEKASSSSASSGASSTSPALSEVQSPDGTRTTIGSMKE